MAVTGRKLILHYFKRNFTHDFTRDSPYFQKKNSPTSGLTFILVFFCHWMPLRILPGV